MPCRAPVILRQCRVLLGTPRSSRKKPNAGRSTTCRFWTADANSHMSFHGHAALIPRCTVALRSHFQNGMVVAWHGLCMGVACMIQTRLHCMNQVGSTQSKPLAARHGRVTACERYGMCELAFGAAHQVKRCTAQ
jgi:hypothetical protein